MNYLLKIGLWAIFGALPACAGGPPVDLGEAPPEIQLEGVGFKFFRENELRAVGKASHATFMRDTGDGSAQSVRMRLLASADATDRSEVELAAREIHGNIRTQQVAAQGGVRIAEAGGAAGVTNTASLDGPAHLVTGKDPVDISGVGYHVHSDRGFRLDISGPGSLALSGPIDSTVGGWR
jgi:hypothetical protein